MIRNDFSLNRGGQKNTTSLLAECFIKMHKLTGAPVSPELTAAETLALYCVYIAPESKSDSKKTISHVSRTLQVSSPTVTQQINNLEKIGYVKRNVDGNDRRMVRIAVTDTGKKYITGVIDKMVEDFSCLTEAIGEEKVIQFVETFNEMAEFLAARHVIDVPTDFEVTEEGKKRRDKKIQRQKKKEEKTDL